MEHDMIQDLVNVIKQEEALLREFLELLESQKTLLVDNKVEDFESTVRAQEELIGRIKTLENERIRRVRDLAKDMDINENEITLTRLVEMSLGQISDELSDAKRSMTHLVERIRRANQVNRYLIKRSLNRAHRSIDILIDESLRDNIYESSGRLSGQDRRSLLVNKTL